MKKIQSIIFSAFALTAALVSCSDHLDNAEGVSVSMDNEIQITAMLDNEVATRASSFGSATLTKSNISEFYMNAYKSDNSPLISIIKVDNAYTAGKFTPVAETEKWTDGASIPYYWPTGDVKFMAIACSDGTQPAINITSTGLTMTGFQVEKSSGEKVEDEPNYLTQQDYIAAVTTANADESFTVGLQFQHLLSRLSLNMWAPIDKFTHTESLELVGFRFESVGIKGNFSFTGANTESTFASNCWSDATSGNVGVKVDDSEDLTEDVAKWDIYETIPKGTAISGTGKLTDNTPWLNVIPGSNVADKLVVYIKLTPTGENPTAYYKSVSLDISALETAPVSEYKPGYEYIYNLKVTGQDDDEGEIEQYAIELESVSVGKWNSTTAGTADTPTNVGNNTLKDILENAELFSRINLLSEVSLKGDDASGDYTYNYPIEVKNSCTLNLNAQPITVAAPAQGETNAPTAVFTIDNGVRFVIVDEHSGSTNGSFTINNSSAAPFNIVAAAEGKTKGMVVIRGGEFSFDPSAYIEGTTTDTFSGDSATKTFTQNFTDETTGEAKVRTTTVTLSNGTYAVSQTITTNENQ